MSQLLLLLPLLVLLVRATVLPLHDSHGHSHDSRSPLPDTWYHPSGHRAYDLFRRAPPDDGVDYPAVGSPSAQSDQPIPRASLTPYVRLAQPGVQPTHHNPPTSQPFLNLG